MVFISTSLIILLVRITNKTRASGSLQLKPKQLCCHFLKNLVKNRRTCRHLQTTNEGGFHIVMGSELVLNADGTGSEYSWGAWRRRTLPNTVMNYLV
jgi:hypothetical protein